MEDIKAMTDQQLVHQELQLERDLIEASFRHRTGQLDDTSKLKKLRRAIARARTEQRNRERAQDLVKDALRNTHRGSFQPNSAPTSESGEPAAGGGFLSGIADQLGIGGADSE